MDRLKDNRFIRKLVKPLLALALTGVVISAFDSVPEVNPNMQITDPAFLRINSRIGHFVDQAEITREGFDQFRTPGWVRLG